MLVNLKRWLQRNPGALNKYVKDAFSDAVKILLTVIVNESGFSSLEDSLLSMENLDRSSPELWPEKFPGMSDFINSFSPTNTTKPPYSKVFTPEDTNYLHQLAALSTAGLISKVKDLHDIAYQLGVEESKEMTRGKYLNLFNKPRRPT